MSIYHFPDGIEEFRKRVQLEPYPEPSAEAARAVFGYRPDALNEPMRCPETGVLMTHAYFVRGKGYLSAEAIALGYIRALLALIKDESP